MNKQPKNTITCRLCLGIRFKGLSKTIFNDGFNYSDVIFEITNLKVIFFYLVVSYLNKNN